MSKTVLIIDDSLFSRTLINETLTAADFEVVGLAVDGHRGIDMAIVHEPDIITLDNILPDMLGSDVIKALKEEKLNSKIIVISAVGQESEKNKLLDLGAFSYVQKPVSPKELLDEIYKLV